MGDTFIIAEAGLSHCGDVGSAIRLAIFAKEAGADAVKFQTWFHDKWPELNHCILSKEEWELLFEACDNLGIKWFSTPFDFEAIDFLADCGMDIWKIPSGMVTNKDFLRCMKEKKPSQVLMSIGMSTIDEIREAFYIFVPDIRPVVMQCTTAYPAPYDEVNLRVLTEWGVSSFGLPWPVGLSDHTLGIEIPIAAVALGATVIEKHFCLSRKGKGPDDHMSLEPHEFKEMVRCIRNVELAMGDGIKKPTPSELKVRDAIRAKMKGKLL